MGDLTALGPQVLEGGRQWWKLRNRSGQSGYVPCNILDEARPEDAGAPLEQVPAFPGSVLPHPHNTVLCLGGDDS